MDTNINKYTISFGISATITIILNTILMILKEKILNFHNFLVTLSGHHWISHGIVDIVIFILLGFIISKRVITKKISILLILSTIISVAGIMIFFI